MVDLVLYFAIKCGRYMLCRVAAQDTCHHVTMNMTHPVALLTSDGSFYSNTFYQAHIFNIGSLPRPRTAE